MFSRFFIDRPIFAAVLSIVITLAGGVAVFSLPIAQYPPITPPTIQVQCNYPGASAQVVAETVASPIEQQVNGVENMLYMSSQCANDGSYSLGVTFEPGVNLNFAQVLVQNRVNLALPSLPDVVRQTGVTTRKRSPDILLLVSLNSPDDRYDQLYISNYASIQVKDELARLDGVGDVFLFGQQDYSMRVWVDPQKLAGLNMTAGDVVKAIHEQNIQVASGQIGQPPMQGLQEFQFPVSTLGRLSDPNQFANIILKTSPEGRVVKIKDIGHVALGARNQDITARLDGKPSCSVAVFQLPDSNALDTADRIRVKMEELKKSFPEGITYDIAYDTTPFIRESVSEVFKTLEEAIILVALVVLVFLQNWRSSLIPLVAVPVAIVGTFAAMAAIGFSLNNLTLFGLVLAIGIVVDDAIVVVEAVEHHIEEGLPPREATIKAMDEVSAPVIAVALVLAAVFIPCAFISGITGQFFRQFALTIAVSTVISAFNSLTLSPALAAILLKPTAQSRLNPLPRVVYALLGGWVGYELPGNWLSPLLTWLGRWTGSRTLDLYLGQLPSFAPWIGLPMGVVAGWFLGRWLNRALFWFFKGFNVSFKVGTDLYSWTVEKAISGRAPLSPLVFAGVGGWVGYVLAARCLPFLLTQLGQWIGPRPGEIYLARWLPLASGICLLLGMLVGWFLLSTWSVRQAREGKRFLSRFVFAVLGGLVGFELLAQLLPAIFGLMARQGWIPVMDLSAPHFLRILPWLSLAAGLVVGWRLLHPLGAGKAIPGSLFVLTLYGGLLILTYWGFTNLPVGYIPTQDKGYLLVSIQLPDASSLERTRKVVDRVDQIGHETPGVASTITVGGQSFVLGANGSNFGQMFVTLDDFSKRHDPRLSSDAIAAQIRRRAAAEVPDGMVTVFGPPPVSGLGTAGGFKFMVEDRGDLGLPTLQGQTENLIAQANKQQGLMGVFSVFRANSPQLFVDVNRDQCAILGVQLSDVFNTLQIYLGSLYVNDFNLFGRTWQVVVQADSQFRNQVGDVQHLKVRNAQGQMVPMGTVARVYEINGPLLLTRYNMYPAAAINGNTAPGVSSGDGIALMQNLAKQQLPAAMSYEWTEMAFIQLRSGNTAMIIFALAVLLVFLVLAALYESWALPLAIILVVPMCLLGSIAGVAITHSDINIFTQIGFVVLVGLASKNAILIVEFAKIKRDEGKPLIEATLEACRLRLRPILMTSFAFILGVVPLLVAAGAGAEMRRTLGTAVFSGMIGVTLFGIFLTPVFFFVIDWLAEAEVLAWLHKRHLGVVLVWTFTLAGFFLAGSLLVYLGLTGIIRTGAFQRWLLILGGFVLLGVLLFFLGRSLRQPPMVLRADPKPDGHGNGGSRTSQELTPLYPMYPPDEKQTQEP